MTNGTKIAGTPSETRVAHALASRGARHANRSRRRTAASCWRWAKNCSRWLQCKKENIRRPPYQHNSVPQDRKKKSRCCIEHPQNCSCKYSLRWYCKHQHQHPQHHNDKLVKKRHLGSKGIKEKRRKIINKKRTLAACSIVARSAGVASRPREA